MTSNLEGPWKRNSKANEEAMHISAGCRVEICAYPKGTDLIFENLIHLDGSVGVVDSRSAKRAWVVSEKSYGGRGGTIDVAIAALRRLPG